jgi:uncharacterized protein YdaU (DUF1376 family)
VNYYRRFIGDYARKTKHLTTYEHGVYTLLLDYLYATEKPIPSESIAFRIANAHVTSQKRAVTRVLVEFFNKKPSGFSNKRFEEELKLTKTRINIARKNGRQSHGRPQKVTTNTKPSGLFSETQRVNSPTPTPYKSKTLNSSSSQDQAIKPLERESHKKRLSLRHVPLERVTLDPSMIDLAQNQHIDASTEFQRLLDYNRARGVAVLHDVHAVWRRWIDSAVHYKKANGESGPTIDEQIAEYERNTGLDFYTQKPKRNTQPD